MSTIMELAERTGIDSGEVTGLLDSLRDKGWVKALRPNAAGPLRWVLSEGGRTFGLEVPCLELTVGVD